MNGAAWSPAQRAAIALCRSATLPILLSLGPDHVVVFNDACIPLLGDPDSARLRDRLLPLLHAVTTSGVAQEPQAIAMEPTVAVHCSPLRAEAGLAVEGVFCVFVQERGAAGKLLASIAHEINQPLAAASANASACLRWLATDPPDLEEAAAAASHIVRDMARAGEIVRRIGQIQAAKPASDRDS